jgi:hypothetical protein
MSAASTTIETAEARKAAGSAAWFKRAMWLGLAVDIVLGILLICWPAWTLGIVHIDAPVPALWTRYAGLLLICLALFSLPAAFCPLGYFYNAALAVKVRALSALFFLIAWDAYLWLAALDAALALLLALLLWRAWRDDLMSRP